MTNAAKTYKVMVTVKQVTKGECPKGFKPGDSWIIDGKTPTDMCLGAFAGLLPTIRTLSAGGEYPWQADPDVDELSCTDPKHWVIYEVRRLRESKLAETSHR